MNYLFLSIIVFFLFFMISFSIFNSRRTGRFLRDMPAFYKIKGAVEVSVEDGSGIHISLGRGDVTSPQAASAFIGLSMLKEITSDISTGDTPPTASTGNGTLAILAQDTLRVKFESMGKEDLFRLDYANVAGLTPFSYAAGTMPIVFKDSTSTLILAGSVGNEFGLIASAAERGNTLTMAGSDNLTGQAMLYALTDEPLIGEELYAGPAYFSNEKTYDASLHTQDVARWVIISIMILAAIFGFFSGII
jgi:hypothetical protein